MAASQLDLKSSWPLSQVSPGSTRPESTMPGVFSERSVTYMYMIYGLGFRINYQTKSKINIKKNIDKHCSQLIELLLD